MSDHVYLDSLKFNSGKVCLQGSFSSTEHYSETLDRQLEAQIYHLGLGERSNFKYGKDLVTGPAPVENKAAPAARAGRVAGAGGTNAAIVWNTLTQSHGFTAEAAAGVIGNLMQESGVQPAMHQNGGGPGRGIMQWTESQRWQTLIAWAARNGGDRWSLETQIGFMIHEMNTRKSNRKSIYNGLKGMRNITEATIFFEETMEVAGTPMMEKRINYAMQAYQAFAGK